MEGLFYNHDNDGLTFLRLFADGRVIAYGKSTKFDPPLQTFSWFRVDTDRTLFASGIYQIEDGDKLKIRVIGDYGAIDYRGTIRDKDTLYLNCRCPSTNYRKSEKYFRFSEKEHIINFEVSHRNEN